MSRFAESDAEARRRFKLYGSRDPFPEISPALLNAADIADYVAATGMIYPFCESRLKSASYEAALGGPVIFWDDSNQQKRIELSRDKKNSFTLSKNSIAFVTFEPKLRLPDYLALRFNLRITNVHCGLLLGTGPLVDPGFEGRLVIPLHNLTTNNYTFVAGEDLIWIEFTKLSENPRWTKPGDKSTRLGKYITFPEGKKNLEIDYYLAQAAPHHTIRSSIADAVEGARKDADSAERSARIIRNAVAGIGFVSLIGLSYGFYQVLTLVEDSQHYVTDARQQLSSLESKVEQLEATIQRLQTTTNNLELSRGAPGKPGGKPNK